MKKIISILVVTLMLVSCSKEDSQNVSTITYYPEFQVMGDDVIFLDKGQEFVDPGVIATEGATEIPFTTTITGKYRGGTTLDTNVVDIYQIVYTATNQDGFSGSVARTVYVIDTGDLTTSIAGLYTSTVARNGTSGAAYTNMEYVLIWEKADGSFQISDAFAGWYSIGRAIAGSDTPGGIIVANNIATNDFSFPGTLTNDYFGGVVNMTDLTVDAATKKMTLKTTWIAPGTPPTNYQFVATLTQVPL
ncbi:immunoglobulin-like domain-containing protein [Flavobacterium sp.]